MNECAECHKEFSDEELVWSDIAKDLVCLSCSVELEEVYEEELKKYEKFKESEFENE